MSHYWKKATNKEGAGWNETSAAGLELDTINIDLCLKRYTHIEK